MIPLPELPALTLFQVEAEGAQRSTELATLRSAMEAQLTRVRGEAAAAQGELLQLRGEVEGLLKVRRGEVEGLLKVEGEEGYIGLR